MKTSRKPMLKNRLFIHIKGIVTKTESEKFLVARVREAERFRLGSKRRKAFKYKNAPFHHSGYNSNANSQQGLL